MVVKRRGAPVFAAEPTGQPGVYRARVVFPSAGTWSYGVDDGFAEAIPARPRRERGQIAPVEAAPTAGRIPLALAAAGGAGLAAGSPGAPFGGPARRPMKRLALPLLAAGLAFGAVMLATERREPGARDSELAAQSPGLDVFNRWAAAAATGWRGRLHGPIGPDLDERPGPYGRVAEGEDHGSRSDDVMPRTSGSGPRRRAARPREVPAGASP